MMKMSHTVFSEVNNMDKIAGMQDGGTRVTFGENSGQREDYTKKSRLDLLSPFALFRLGDWVGKGARKYDARNWEKGLPYMGCIGSIMRHALKFVLRDDSEDHLAAIMCNAMFLIHYEECKMTTFDDRPSYDSAADFLKGD